MRRTRRSAKPPDLTSLFDVLFIVIFAALIRAAAVQQAAAEPAPLPPPEPLDPASLHARALVELGARPAVVVRVSAAGTVTAIEADGQTTQLDVPLLEHVADPDVAVAYLGDRSLELRMCRIAALHLGVAELASYLVIVAPAARLADLPHALYDGLHRDLDRCAGLAVIVEPK